ncbi:DUF4435 domain-containing protein [Xanthomonas bonasiae]|uniref:DUF4435 domain-containing protein n=1 Tax=Xanthomonas bonasiae TaxID=2810351 RepID=UPI001781EBAA|nr:DUF4435 domain-containing protein [Xanthomonas surreyensis]MBD7923726.1 DUF4435 domain-containing protein [Xanthomonas surreyensis]
MSSYSLGGYRIAIQARSSKTLIVEGKSDRLVLQRIFLEPIMGSAVGGRVRVDSVDLVQDAALAGKGAREKVSIVTSLLNKLEGKAKGLLDREWDFFCTDTYAENNNGDIGENIFLTRGHSIENYFFDPGVCCDFLKKKYATCINPTTIDLAYSNFGKIIDFAFAYSVTCRRVQLIDRLDRLLTPMHLEWNGRFSFSLEFADALTRRGVDASTCRRFNEVFERVTVEVEQIRAGETSGRWNSHGHLGEDSVWACIGRLAMDSGVSQIEAEQICCGHREERLQSSAHILAANFNSELTPFEAIISWAQD